VRENCGPELSSVRLDCFGILGLAAPPIRPPKRLRITIRPNTYEIHPIPVNEVTKGAKTKGATRTPIVPATNPASAPRPAPRATSPAIVPAIRANTNPIHDIHARKIKRTDPSKIPRPMFPAGLACLKALRSAPQFGQKSVSNHFPQPGQKVKVLFAFHDPWLYRLPSSGL